MYTYLDMFWVAKNYKCQVHHMNSKHIWAIQFLIPE